MKSSKRFGWLAVCLAIAMVAAGFGAYTWQAARAETVQQAAAEQVTFAEVVSPFQQVYKQVSQSVVSVNVVVQTQFNRGRIATTATSQLAGSGVVIKVDAGTSYILTNNHVVSGGQSYSITAGDEEYDATLVAADSQTDVAVLKVNDAAFSVPAVPIGDSDSLEVGEWCMVIGTPLDASFANTLTVGVISGLNREVTTRSGRTVQTNTMIQTDAAINSGNSGGALFNTKGELIGIPSMKMSTSGVYGIASIEGIGMAIPINTAMQVVPDLIEYQQVMRPRIGVSIGSTDSDTDEPTETQLPAGIFVYSVEEGSPAERAGIKPYDIIIEADGERVRTTADLSAKVQSHTPGETVEIKVYRIPDLARSRGTTYETGEYLTFDVSVEILDAPKQ
ncbi:MAG: trypsin-like peptidase domain-containing protein [Oscillospiraceae bacterium]|nr:trypsin-like peptidase domain-containing protein [Oscillospiraceae bacterium]